MSQREGLQPKQGEQRTEEKRTRGRTAPLPPPHLLGTVHTLLCMAKMDGCRCISVRASNLHIITRRLDPSAGALHQENYLSSQPSSVIWLITKPQVKSPLLCHAPRELVASICRPARVVLCIDSCQTLRVPPSKYPLPPCCTFSSAKARYLQRTS